jgi:hypothetical protein
MCILIYYALIMSFLQITRQELRKKRSSPMFQAYYFPFPVYKGDILQKMLLITLFRNPYG